MRCSLDSSYLASISKVCAWRCAAAQETNMTAVSSCYGSGSLPTSPTPLLGDTLDRSDQTCKLF